jgi:DNA processing protein
VSGVERYDCLDPSDEGYPAMLRCIKKPPDPLYYFGDAGVLSRIAVAVVGSRRATDYGRWVAFNLAKRLSERGVVVVSGMAEGIDTYAHLGALEGATPTVAVMGCGLDICFPVANRALRQRILERGVLLSEYPEGTRGSRYTFPQRNRIISGICRATVVVEAGISSGSLITAEHAVTQGRDVYAVPGNINRRMSIGCNKLIRDGAIPLVLLDDVAEGLSLPARAGASTAENARIEVLGGDERRVLESVLDRGGLMLDDVAALTGMSVSLATSVVTLLEMKGFVFFESGRVIPANRS